MIEVAERSIEEIPLTIAIPTYNRRHTVQVLLNSICDQARSGDEVIVSDDGSTDGTAELLSKVPGVKVIRHDINQGLVANWNTCLHAATRDWICIVHDDDRLEPGALDALRCACALAKGPALILHQYAGHVFDGGFRYIFSEPSPGTILNCPMIPSGAVLHRTIMDAVGFFDPHYKYFADLEYFPRIITRFPLIIIESPHIVEYRRHGENYQFHAARNADFYDLFEEMQRLIISYAGIQDEKQKRDILDKKMVGALFYTLDMADRIGDRRLVRLVGKRCLMLRHRLTSVQKVKAYVSAITGWCPRARRAERLRPL
jgi:glycosyltransferase involved in cell wall biosynthesis